LSLPKGGFDPPDPESDPPEGLSLLNGLAGRELPNGLLGLLPPNELSGFEGGVDDPGR
jgi:hypothetical protein